MTLAMHCICMCYTNQLVALAHLVSPIMVYNCKITSGINLQIVKGWHVFVDIAGTAAGMQFSAVLTAWRQQLAGVLPLFLLPSYHDQCS